AASCLAPGTVRPPCDNCTTEFCRAIAARFAATDWLVSPVLTLYAYAVPSTRMPAVWPGSAVPPNITVVPSITAVRVGFDGAPIHCSEYRVVVRVDPPVGN